MSLEGGGAGESGHGENVPHELRLKPARGILRKGGNDCILREWQFGVSRFRREGFAAISCRATKPVRERPRYAKVRPMPTLADMLKNPNAYRGACGDLCAGALRLSPQELADLTLQVAGQSPQRARQIVAEHLSKAAAGDDAQAAGTSAQHRRSTATATGATAAGCTCATFAAGPAARFAG